MSENMEGNQMKTLICGDCGIVLATYEQGNRAEAEQQDGVIMHTCIAQDRANRAARQRRTR